MYLVSNLKVLDHASSSNKYSKAKVLLVCVREKELFPLWYFVLYQWFSSRAAFQKNLFLVRQPGFSYSKLAKKKNPLLLFSFQMLFSKLSIASALGLCASVLAFDYQRVIHDDRSINAFDDQLVTTDDFRVLTNANAEGYQLRIKQPQSCEQGVQVSTASCSIPSILTSSWCSTLVTLTTLNKMITSSSGSSSPALLQRTIPLYSGWMEVNVLLM